MLDERLCASFSAHARVNAVLGLDLEEVVTAIFMLIEQGTEHQLYSLTMLTHVLPGAHELYVCVRKCAPFDNFASR